MKRLLMLAACAAALSWPAFAQDAVLERAVAQDYEANLAALWDHFHRNPELSGLEVQTAARMAQELEALGYEVTTGVGGHGVVAILRNGDGPTVMLRADMDGLPIAEDSGLTNASTARQVDHDGTEKPVMHACGHDVHITALVGTARQMMARRDGWSGTLILIAQPAEETISGARTMMQDGLYERFPKPDYAVAFHVASGLEAGRIMVPEAIAYARTDSVDNTVRGGGAHAPHGDIHAVRTGIGDGLGAGGHMEGDGVIGLGETFVQAVFHHGSGAGDGLLRRLGDQDQGAGPTRPPRLHLAGRAHKGGDVHIVATGVHDRFLGSVVVHLPRGRSVGQAAIFFKG